MRLSEAKSLRHGQTVYIKDAYDTDGRPSKCRVTGSVKTWARSPEKVQVPVRRGLRDNGYITESNLNRFTLTAPAARKPVKRPVTQATAGSRWIAEPHGPWRTREGAQRFADSSDHTYSDIRVAQGADGLWRMYWKPKGM